MIVGEMPETVGPFAAGSRYCANDIPSLRWVHATLVETALMAHDLVLPPLSAEERERYWTESRMFGALFGLTADDLPADWSGFAAYTAAMAQSDTLTVSPAAREIAAQIFGGARPWLRPPRWYRALTASLLPERLRAGFGFELEERDMRAADNALRWIQARLSEIAGSAALCRSLSGSAGAAAGRAAARLDDPVSQSRLDRTAANGSAREGVRFSALG